MVESTASKDEFLVQHKDFSLRECVIYPNGGYSHFYDNGEDMVIIDHNAADRKRAPENGHQEKRHYH